jgi:antitoxin VapB
METTKIFMVGRSQAVRIPKKYRFNASQVEIRRQGDSIVLSPIIDREAALRAFHALPPCPDFQIDREDVQKIQERNLFNNI